MAIKEDVHFRANAVLIQSWANLSNRFGLFIDMHFPPWSDVLKASRNFWFKPYYRWRANRLFCSFEQEVTGAAHRYKRCWTRLTQDRIILLPLLGMQKVKSPYINALNHLSQLRSIRSRLQHRPWYQLSTQLDWYDLEQLLSLCQNEWNEQVAQCGLELAQDEAAGFVAQRFEPEVAERILGQVNRLRRPGPGPAPKQPPQTIDGECWRLD